MAESMKGLKRTHRCTELSAANVGEEVTVMGWVQKKQKQGRHYFCGPSGQERDFTDYF